MKEAWAYRKPNPWAVTTFPSEQMGKLGGGALQGRRGPVCTADAQPASVYFLETAGDCHVKDDPCYATLQLRLDHQIVHGSQRH